MISSCWRAASSVFLASSSEILAICTLASPLTKKRQSQEPERMVSLWFVQKKKNIFIARQGGGVERAREDGLEGESPSSYMGSVCREEEPAHQLRLAGSVWVLIPLPRATSPGKIGQALASSPEVPYQTEGASGQFCTFHTGTHPHQ